MADPLAGLRLPLTPLAPRAAFATDLRRRLAAALHEGDPQPVTVNEVHANLICRDAARALRFLTDAFGAVVDYRLDMPDGRVGHAEALLGGFRLTVADPFPEHGFHPPTDAIPPVSLTLMVDDCDAALARAVAAGAQVEREAADQFYGHRTAVVRDLEGHRWMLQQELERLTPEQMQARMNAGDAG